MIDAITTRFVETFTDMFSNTFSILVLILLIILLLSLFLASISDFAKRLLISSGFLDEHESPRALLQSILLLILAVKCLQAFIVQPFIVDGGSMLPQFHTDELLLVDKLSYAFSDPKRGDVVIFKLFESTNGGPYEGKYLIKRIIGLPGEKVSISRGVTTVYNQANPEGTVIPETFVQFADLDKDVSYTLNQDQYFVMGDNRAQSFDSRSWGPLEAKQLRGRALIRVFPFSVFTILPGNISL